MLPMYSAGLLRRLTAATGLYALGVGGMVDAELDAELAGFAPVLLEMTDAQRGPFPQLCGEERLCAWERLTGGARRPDAADALRRARVCSYLALSPGDCTRQGIQRCLLAAGLVATVTEDFSTGRLTVTVEEFTDPDYPAANAIADAARMMPAHLEAVFLYGGQDWTGWESQNITWQVFDAAGYTWQQCDIATT